MLKIINGVIIVIFLHIAVGVILGVLMNNWKIGAVIGGGLGILLTAFGLILDVSRPEDSDRRIVAVAYMPLVSGSLCAATGILGLIIGKLLSRPETGVKVGLLLGVIIGAFGAIGALRQLASDR